MPTFKYTARDQTSGKKIEAEVEATDEKTASRLIKASGYVPITITNPSEKKGFLGIGKTTKVPAKEKVIFARQLSTLINASLPLLQALRMVADQTNNKAFKGIITQVANDLEGGMPFSKALSRYPSVFNPIFVGVVSAAEASGTLDTSLERLAEQQERDADIVGKVRGAMIYPAIVLVVMILVVTFMVVKVLPQVQAMYNGFGAKMPLITRALLAVSHGVIKWWWIVIVAGIFVGFFVRRWARTESGISTVDEAKMKLPILGPLFTKLYMARFTRICATLISSGLPLLQVLQIASGAMGNVHISKSVTAAAEKVRGGRALSDSLTGDPNFLPLVPSMIRIGEQSGALETMMGKTADYYEKDVGGQVDTMSATLEPVLMVVMGVVALIIVAAVLLPIYSLVGKNINVV